MIFLLKREIRISYYQKINPQNDTCKISIGEREQNFNLSNCISITSLAPQILQTPNEH